MNLRCRRRPLACPRTLNIFVTALLAVLAGCTAVIVRPVLTQAPAGRWEAGQMLDALAQRRQQFHSLRAAARVAYAGPDGKNGFDEAILIQRPDRLRLETLTMLGAILIVTVNDKEIIGYYPRDGIYVRGQGSKANLLKVTKIPLELDEMTGLLLGLPPLDAREPAQSDGNSLTFASNGRKDRVSFELNEAVPTKWQRVDGDGQVELSASFNDYIQTPAGFFPSRILIESPGQKKQLEIR
ncbi:MAG TPA: DUF4292 domain-containing protein, partial [Methylomirabilota bacterium]|nr:DUF4292 domain-containing protein [Methylomirabilota bacterium]